MLVHAEEVHGRSIPCNAASSLNSASSSVALSCIFGVGDHTLGITYRPAHHTALRLKRDTLEYGYCRRGFSRDS